MNGNTSQPSLRQNTAARSARLRRLQVPLVCAALLAGGAYFEHSLRQLVIEANDTERERRLAIQVADQAEHARQCRLAFPLSQAMQLACLEGSL